MGGVWVFGEQPVEMFGRGGFGFTKPGFDAGDFQPASNLQDSRSVRAVIDHHQTPGGWDDGSDGGFDTERTTALHQD